MLQKNRVIRSRRGFWDIEPFASSAVGQTHSQWLCTLFAVFRITAQQLRISTMSIITLFIIASFWSVNLAKLRSWSRKQEVQTQSPDCGTIASLFSSTEHFTLRQTLTAERAEGSTLTENTESWRKCVKILKTHFFLKTLWLKMSNVEISDSSGSKTLFVSVKLECLRVVLRTRRTCSSFYITVLLS